MAVDAPTESVLLVLSPSPLRTMMRDWLLVEGFDVRVAPAWEVQAALETGGARIVITSDDLDGEWGWSARPGTEVLVLDLPGSGVAPT